MTFFSKDFHKVSIDTFKELVRPYFEEILTKDFEKESEYEKEFLGDEEC